LIVHVPALTVVNTPPLVMVQTPVVADVNMTGRPELAVAVKVGDAPKFCEPGLLNVMVWEAAGVTLFDAADGVPVPAAFMAVTVNV
jgi:hypothetical protein